MTTLKAAPAADLAEMITANNRESVRRWKAFPFAAPYIATVGEAARTGALPPIPDGLAALMDRNPRAGQDLVFTAQQHAACRLWKRYRITYAIDRTLWHELGESDPGDIIPANLFDQLPHSDPFICFPEPLLIDDGGDLVEKVVGVFLSGRRSETVPDAAVAAYGDLGLVPPKGTTITIQCSTHHPERDVIALTFVGVMHRRDGRPHTPGGIPDLVWTHVSFGLDADATVAELVDGCLSRFPSANGGRGVGVMLRRAVSLLIYLCAVNAEIDAAPPAPAPRGRGKGRGAARPKPPRVMNVGYRIGAKLRAYRAASARRASAGGPDDRSVPPHLRRAHFHTFRHGKGRKLRKVTWLPPIPVNFDKEADKTTVIPVPA
ncbi:hypothetical protein [Planomonospora sp. ID82291]|uniref:hypothetical protein n=1 Tax=Planomonospora sp. ID82291 TaxID=2738136 RepID=UPI0018C3F8A8|nr:hypothetical protein [Planomonospora sp. ID82291]MBG0818309.1 hypothetical protein [Planomonospora sp. ID82291]